MAEAPQGKASGVTHKLFVLAILAGSFLLFLVQPMVARMALPKLGGAPAVWNSAMLVYQALLLGGYAYAHWLGRVPVRRQAAIHLGVLAVAALWLPIGLISMNLPADAEPTIWVPWLLVASIGPLFFAIAAQAPLLQRWYSVASGGRDPYALYAASNIGSFGGLITYPILVEPNMALRSQSWMWTGGYALVFLLVAGCALLLPRKSADVPHVVHSSEPPSRRMVLHWIVLALVPSGLMLATTTFLTTDIVAVPLLWVVPLGLYLLSFSVAFSDSRILADLLGKFAPICLLLFGATLISGHHEYAYLNAFIGVMLLFVVSVACHARMYALRPAPDRLTGFYLAMSVGGVLGGVFSALIAPIVFDWTYEYPLLILAAGALVPQVFLFPIIGKLWSGDTQIVRIKVLVVALVVSLLLVAGIRDPFGMGPSAVQFAFLGVAIFGLLSIGKPLAFFASLAAAMFLYGGYQAIQVSAGGDRTRSYFGVYTITDLPDQVRLAHGTTLHGIQLKGAKSRQPTTYYFTKSGVGLAMAAAPELYGPHARIGVVGLGTGTLACYAKPGQQWRIYEIDPAVVRIARDSGKFTFLSQCLPNANIVIGDARLRLAEQGANSLDLLALDAFSSDAVPMHLMTAEAYATYGRVLAPNGLLMVHISNRYLALDPIVAEAARRGGWYAERLYYNPSPDEELVDEAGASDWIALSRDPKVLDRLVARGGEWKVLVPEFGVPGWTDDYASIVPVLRPAKMPWDSDD
ncbi:fused MFS/spermidine synthase [Sphingomonas sp. AOB5]|uniref:spermidine synthase n=1 Tax=Sphingomonas sp. AOB5 TaxID=3034017 RepID=UPI0023F6F446|nr:fused MFS/spermidine synthase [Sphingomonas sp. AOB5]MDF7775497.1 fused MFS/spermidine synthase [Sphingomonas sp. AOB5]